MQHLMTDWCPREAILTMEYNTKWLPFQILHLAPQGCMGKLDHFRLTKRSYNKSSETIFGLHPDQYIRCQLTVTSAINRTICSSINWGPAPPKQPPPTASWCEDFSLTLWLLSFNNGHAVLHGKGLLTLQTVTTLTASFGRNWCFFRDVLLTAGTLCGWLIMNT